MEAVVDVSGGAFELHSQAKKDEFRSFMRQTNKGPFDAQPKSQFHGTFLRNKPTSDSWHLGWDSNPEPGDLRHDKSRTGSAIFCLNTYPNAMLSRTGKELLE